MVNPGDNDPAAAPRPLVVAGDRPFGARRRGRIVFGLFIIAVGVFALLDNLHLFDSRAVQPFWPLVFVALGLLRLASGRLTPARVVWSLGLVGVGAALTLHKLGLLDFRPRDWWPVLLVLAGLSVLARGLLPGAQRWRGRGHCHGRHGFLRDEHGARIQASAVMSSLALRNDAPDFQGGEIDVVMGSVEIDLRQAGLGAGAGGEAHLHLSVVMGGVQVKVPRDWGVSIQGTPALGGIEDRTIPPAMPGKRLVVSGSVVMGGVEITN